MDKINPDIIRLKDILNSISEIESVCGRERHQAFAVAYLIAVIGEAANHVSASIQNQTPAIPWSKIIGMRNKIIHEYGKLDEEILWAVVDNELPKLKTQMSKILSSL